MVIADRTTESYASSKPSSSRTLASTISSNGSSTNGSCSSDMNSDSDNEQSSVRVGCDYQAVIPDSCSTLPAPSDYPEKALMIWTPNNRIDEDKLKEYLHIATKKYHYNGEQALGVLYWHNFNLNCALADLPNFVPFPDEWSIEDKALFEQAYQFYNKNFHKINQLLPDKKISSLVKFYYTWKKVKSKNSFIEKQVKKSNSQAKDDSTTDSATNDALADSDGEFERPISCSGPKEHRKECSSCQTQTSSQLYNTKLGLLCRACFSVKRKDSNSKAACSSNSNKEEDNQVHMANSKAEVYRLPKSLSPLLIDRNILNEIALERQITTKPKVLDSLEGEIDEMKKKVRSLKQENATKMSNISELPEFPLLISNNNRIISRWSETETIILTHAVREYGQDFKVIAEILGNKTESQIKNYFLQNYEKMNLGDVLSAYNNDNDCEDDKMDIEEADDSKVGKSSK